MYWECCAGCRYRLNMSRFSTDREKRLVSSGVHRHVRVFISLIKTQAQLWWGFFMFVVICFAVIVVVF